VDRTGATERRGRTKVVALSIAAVISLVLVGVFGVPAIADRLAPHVPPSVERKFGAAVDAQVRAMLDTDRKGQAFECGHADAEKAGRAALDRLVARLDAAAALDVPLTVAVLRRADANAIALPGGRIYLFDGLIAKAQSVDEVAGVIAHEIGHVAHRDGTRSVLQAAGLSFLFGMVLGDFVGGGAVVIAAKMLLQLSYSREVERRADAFAVELANRIGSDARALGTILTRIEGASHPGTRLLLDHPDTKDRLAAIAAAATVKASVPLLDPAEWAALKRICAPGAR
jgi:Zn-dependent protease with chaperone function